MMTVYWVEQAFDCHYANMYLLSINAPLLLGGHTRNCYLFIAIIVIAGAACIL